MKPGVLLVHGGAGEASLHTLCEQSAVGIRVCPAVLTTLSLCPRTAQLQRRMWQRCSLPLAFACRLGQAAQLLCATKIGLNLYISCCPVERGKWSYGGRRCASLSPQKRHPRDEAIFVQHTLEGGPGHEPSRTGKVHITHP